MKSDTFILERVGSIDVVVAAVLRDIDTRRNARKFSREELVRCYHHLPAFRMAPSSPVSTDIGDCDTVYAIYS
jgi:hypothetical protein